MNCYYYWCYLQFECFAHVASLQDCLPWFVIFMLHCTCVFRYSSLASASSGAHDSDDGDANVYITQLSDASVNSFRYGINYWLPQMHVVIVFKMFTGSPPSFFILGDCPDTRAWFACFRIGTTVVSHKYCTHKVTSALHTEEHAAYS